MRPSLTILTPQKWRHFEDPKTPLRKAGSFTPPLEGPSWFLGFQTIFMFTPTWGNDPIWQAYFSNGLKLPTTVDGRDPAPVEVGSLSQLYLRRVSKTSQVVGNGISEPSTVVQHYPVTVGGEEFLPWHRLGMFGSCCHSANPQKSGAGEFTRNHFSLIRVYPYIHCNCVKQICFI